MKKIYSVRISLLLFAVMTVIFSNAQSVIVSSETFPATFNANYSTSNNSNGTFIGSSGTWTGSVNSNALAATAVVPASYSPVTNAIRMVNWNTAGKAAADCHAASPANDLSGYSCSAGLSLAFKLYTNTCSAADPNSYLKIEFSTDNGSNWSSAWNMSSAAIFSTYGANALTNISISIPASYRAANFKYRFSGYKPANEPHDFFLFIDEVTISAIYNTDPIVIGGINMGNLPKYFMIFTDANQDANWQGATKGFIGDVAIDGITANERTSGTVPYAGTIYTNDATLDAWQGIIDDNTGRAFSSLNKTAIISGLEADLDNAFSAINALPVTAGYAGINPTSLNGLNTEDGIAKTYVINITSGLSVSSQINIIGDEGDIFIFRWDTDANFANGYQGQVKFQSGGAIIPNGGLRPCNFVHVAGDIGSSGGGSTPPAPYPQGPRYNNGAGSLVAGASNFSGGGFFTGYWLTTGDPSNGQSSNLSNGIFVGGWYTKTTKFSMTSGTSGVYVAPVCNVQMGNVVWNDRNHDGIKQAAEKGIANATVNLFVDNNNDNIPDGTAILSTITNNNGWYNFSNLESGNYIVGIVPPSGYTQGVINGGDPDNDTDEDNNGVNIINGQIAAPAITLIRNAEKDSLGNTNTNFNATNDVGLIGTGSIGDYIWNDVNKNGIQDAGEPGISGQTLLLKATEDNAVIQTAITDAVGYYRFNNLAPGSYIIKFPPISNMTLAPTLVGGNMNINSKPDPVTLSFTVTLPPGGVNLTVDGGYQSTFTLPIVFGDFYGSYANGYSQLKWNTIAEYNSSHFEIERSSNGTDFKIIGRKDAKGYSSVNTDYSFVDLLAEPGLNYYRLKMVDLDGSMVYSKIIVLSTEASGMNLLLVYPNPFGNKVQVKIESEKKSKSVINIFNNAGGLVKTQADNLNKGTNIIVVKNVSELPGGIYFLEIITEDRTFKTKILKQ
ncbi:MAG: SdrD B-like domain-containing protein [Ferruginibacter sp.]